MRMDFAAALRAALLQEMARDAAIFAYGEGINDPGGFFGTTAGVVEEVGPDRCFDVPNSEEALAGYAMGAAIGGLRPVFVNLRMEFVLLAANQILNHLAKWPSMHGRDVPMPVTIRAMVGRGWGQGAQHSGFYGSIFAHVPGLHVAVASGPAQGAGLLVAALRGDTPTILIEPKPVFDGDGDVELPVRPAVVGQATVVREGDDFTLVTVGDGVRTAIEVAERSAVQGVSVAVLDATWLAPFDGEALRRAARRTGGRVGVLDIGWAPYGLAAECARQLLLDDAPVRGPMLTWAVEGHAPAGCFAEATHYPSEGSMVDDIVGAVSSSRPAMS